MGIAGEAAAGERGCRVSPGPRQCEEKSRVALQEDKTSQGVKAG